MYYFSCFHGITQKVAFAVVWLMTIITCFILSQMASFDIPDDQMTVTYKNTTMTIQEYQYAMHMMIPPSLFADANVTNQSIIYSRERNLTVPPAATTGWDNYRLGDMFRNYKQRIKNYGFRKHVRDFNASIATEYMRRIKHPFNGSNSDYDTMLQILNE